MIKHIFTSILCILTFNVYGSGHYSNFYNRDAFKHWIDEDGDCFNTRHEILQSDSIEPVIISGCRVIRGKWYGEYSGDYYDVSSDLDLDHIVPLKEAWDSGAYKWNDELRKAFANDGDNLILVSKRLNRSKGAKDPARWMPPNDLYRCGYIERWVYIKEKYNLSMDAEEYKFLDHQMKLCDPSNNDII
jgi:hypothetical protein